MDLKKSLLNYNENEEEKKELKNLLHDIKKINEINNDILLIINDQHENILAIENDTNKTIELSEKANNDLEITSGYSFKFAPIAIGGGIGALLTIPFTTSASIGVIGYSLLGGSIAGGVLGKHFS
jgi:hypothetical protein